MLIKITLSIGFRYYSKIRGDTIERSHKTAHDQVHECDLLPADGEKLNHVTIDETVVRPDRHRYQLYPIVDQNRRNTSCTAVSNDDNRVDGTFPQGLTTKYEIDDAVFPVD